VTRRLPDRAALAGASNFVVPRSTRESPLLFYEDVQHSLYVQGFSSKLEVNTAPHGAEPYSSAQPVDKSKKDNQLAEAVIVESSHPDRR
jgi:hypothetical protein